MIIRVAVFSILFFTIQTNAKVKQYGIINDVIFNSSYTNFSFDKDGKIVKASDWQVDKIKPGVKESYFDSVGNSVELNYDNGKRKSFKLTRHRTGEENTAYFNKQENIVRVLKCKKNVSVGPTGKTDPIGNKKCIDVPSKLCGEISNRAEKNRSIKDYQALLDKSRMCQSISDNIITKEAKSKVSSKDFPYSTHDILKACNVILNSHKKFDAKAAWKRASDQQRKSRGGI